MFERSRFEAAPMQTTKAVSSFILAAAITATAAAAASRPTVAPTPTAEREPAGAAASTRSGESGRTGMSSRGGGDTLPDLALVRTVSVPGGLSAEMRMALQSMEGLFSRSSESPRSTVAPSGARVLILGSGFLKVYVARLDEQGKINGACVSSLDEALRVMGASTPGPGKGAISSDRAVPTPEEE